jgi:hypothetical protein
VQFTHQRHWLCRNGFDVDFHAYQSTLERILCCPLSSGGDIRRQWPLSVRAQQPAIPGWLSAQLVTARVRSNNCFRLAAGGLHRRPQQSLGDTGVNPLFLVCDQICRRATGQADSSLAPWSDRFGGVAFAPARPPAGFRPRPLAGSKIGALESPHQFAGAVYFAIRPLLFCQHAQTS